MNDTKRTMRRKALGRTAFIGSLYDATRDIFCGTTILRGDLPKDSVKNADIPHTESLYEYEDTYKEKFNKLDVEAELKVSVLMGLLSLEGSGKYLNDVKDSLRTVKGTLIYKITSVEENLNIYHDDIKPCISMDGFNNLDATHVVIGIKWGAAIMASFEYKNMKKDNKTQVEGALKAHLEKLSFSITGSAKVDFEEGESSSLDRFSMKLLGDIIPQDKELPQSFDDAKKVMAELHLYIKQYNDGKGIPVEYVLYPLSEFAKLFSQHLIIDRRLTELNEETIIRVDQVFDDLLESKQRLNDFFNDAQSISDYIPDKILEEINSHVQKFKIEEARFRRELANCLINIRSGKVSTNELESNIETFQGSILSKVSIMTFFQKFRTVSIKADLMQTLKSKNVEYLGKNSTVDQILYKYLNNHVYILFEYNDENTNITDDKSSLVYSVFRDLLILNDEKSKFFIADANMIEKKYPVIRHYINGKLEGDDYYKDNEVLFTSNLVKFDPVPCIKPKYSPDRKTQLMVPCPQDCSPTSCNWKCVRCKQDVEYGFNGYLYCGCGESGIASCKFKCNSPSHTDGYVPYELNRLNELLPSETPEEINILILGETGVGKSTFINAFANYLKFDSLDDAKSGKMEVLIPSKFTLTDENYETKVIRIGDDDPSEQLDSIGMSATQDCKGYVFHATGNKLIRLIDTPGIGDTRGIEQDEKNFDNILRYISYHKYLNGICILLKPNNARLSIVFRFCIQELLSHLHRNAKDNIVFLFTNARGTFYRPGDTLPPLKKQLQDLKDRSNVEIKVNSGTVYCFDNESFRFLAAIKEGVSFEETDERNFAESWSKSVDESLRLMKYLLTRTPHQIKDTISLNNARNIVIILSKPLAEIGQTIQTNIKLIEQQQTEIKSSDLSIGELKKNKLYIPQIDLEPVQLGYPRTVCTSSTCVKSLKIDKTDISKIDYVTHCHEHCYLNGVESNVINNAELRNCSAMNNGGNCNICKCNWSKHMHITYENKKITKNAIDENILSQITKMNSDQDAKKEVIKSLEAKVTQLKIEQMKINETSIKFAQFLRQNSIAAYNDAYAEYLDHFIKEEKIKKSSDPAHYNDQILDELEKTRRNYIEQVEVIKEAIKNNDPSISQISPDEIANLEKQLYDLPINGETLKNIKDQASRSQDNTFKYTEKIILPDSKKSFLSKLKSIFKPF